ncbi:MAG: 1-deoxy-D-xylulose-5-phosphate reductoisomerase [Bacilli bacterium]
MKNLAILGITGSIGTQVLDIIQNDHNYCVQSLAFGNNLDLGLKIIEQVKPKFVSVLNNKIKDEVFHRFPNLAIGVGDQGLVEAATYVNENDYLINALVGVKGLVPTVKAIEKKINILLANKETLVVGGDIIMPLVKKQQVSLIPIDSEHSAIFQCLQSGKPKEVEKLILTASGGPFLKKSREELKFVDVPQALKHPNWKMGPKITIDSATMVNKGLEIMEAHHLFLLPYSKIQAVIHPESIIHSMVEFVDSSVIAQMSLPDMRLPIQYALTYPNRQMNHNFKKLDFSKPWNLNFIPLDFERFLLVKLAYQVGNQGGIMPTVYNAANEAAVSLFLKQKISILDIETIIFQAVNNTVNLSNPSIEQLMKISHDVNEQILQQYEVENG